MDARERERRIQQLEDDVKKMQAENKRLFGYTRADRKRERKKKMRKTLKKIFFTDLGKKRRRF